MITHDQLIFTLRYLFPQIREEDHGRKYWVAMPVEGGTQVGPAWIVSWGFDFEQPDEETIQAKWREVRDERLVMESEAAARSTRNTLLEEADLLFYKALDSSDTAKVQEVSTYRQALRDVPLQAGFPDQIDWPIKPEI